MSEMRPILVDSAARLFERHCTRAVFEASENMQWQQNLWDALEAAGLPRASRNEARGGDGADLGDALALVREAGRACLPAPLAETLLAELLLAEAGLAPMPGPLTASGMLDGDTLQLVKRDGSWALSGRLHRVPWGRHARAVVAVAACDGGLATVVVEKPPLIEPGSNYAGEPRDDLQFDGLAVPDRLVAVACAMAPERQRVLGAAFRAAAMAGALERVLTMTIRYAQERQQFGRPIGKFQAVQQQIAVLAAEVAAAGAAVDAMLDTVGVSAADFEIGVTKSRVSEAAGTATAIAHQVHGAIGFTHEHALHRSTRRLWAWRDEYGTEGEWAEWVGRCIAGLISSEALWPFITAKEALLSGSSPEH